MTPCFASVGAMKNDAHPDRPRSRTTTMADRTLFFKTLIPPADIHPKATGSSKTPDRKPLGSLLLSIERMVSGRIGLPLLRCWPPEWVSGEEAEAVAKGVHAFGLAQRWRRELCP